MTAHDIYCLDGQVPETLVSSETTDISPFASFKWYEWTLFQYMSLIYPNNTMIQGHDLGPAINIRLLIMQKVLKANNKVVYCSTVRLFTPNVRADEVMTRKQNKLDQSIEKLWGDLA